MMSIALHAGYSAEQAETLVKVLTQSLQSTVGPIERSALSQEHLASFPVMCVVWCIWYVCVCVRVRACACVCVCAGASRGENTERR